MASWNWTSALIGAATTAATITAISSKPKDPTFELIAIDLTSFKLNLPVLDAELILTVHVTNPNPVPVKFLPATMSIYYDDGSLLGSAQIEAGSQPARSCRMMRLPGRLNGLELAHHASKFLGDVARREMILDATVEISGSAKVLFGWEHRFRVSVESRIVVDPVFLDVIEQDNRSEMDLMVTGDS